MFQSQVHYWCLGLSCTTGAAKVDIKLAGKDEMRENNKVQPIKYPFIP